MSKEVKRGGCLCGAIRYEAKGLPFNITHCHCRDCRRSTGAPFVTWLSFRRNSFRFIRGQPKQIEWADRIRGFCSECGTSLTFATTKDSTDIDVTVGSLDDPDAIQPIDHTWTIDRLSWVPMNDNLPNYSETRRDS